MHVIYADPGLVSEVGHHANSCRVITAALRERGHAVTVAGAQGLQPELAEELGARPHFRLNTYWLNDGDAVAGWLSAFFTSANATAEDFARLGPFGHDTLLFVNSVMPAQLMAIRSFLMGLPDAQRPHVFAELGTGPGLDFIEDAAGSRFVPRDTRVDARATLYRFVGQQLATRPLEPLTIVTFDRSSSELYSALLLQTVRTLPVPRSTTAPLRNRGGARPLTIGVLGHQRGEKGYQFVPAIVQLMLRLRDDVVFLVHNAAPDYMSAVQQEMRVLAAADRRIMLDERPAGPEHWQANLDRCDLILCPYLPAQFRAAYSAVACEAISNAIPLVVPANTSMSRLVAEFGGTGTEFSDASPGGITVALAEAVERIEELSAIAMVAALRWQATMGAGPMVDAMLASVIGGDMLGRMMQRQRPADTQIPIAKVA
jgi:hypothetical protein